jgi:hypothetical protein
MTYFTQKILYWLFGRRSANSVINQDKFKQLYAQGQRDFSFM